MIKKYILFFICIELFFFSACSPSWTEAIKKGKIGKDAFHETVITKVENGLIFVPVVIRGKTYKFLFDSGALFSVSKKLQKALNFKVITTGNIVDSDNNKTSVNYVKVDTTYIGAIPFIDQTAFVADFEANPILKCLEIDGIIGSNLIRFCNWEIDYQNKQIVLINTDSPIIKSKSEIVPFNTDRQYNILVDLKIGDATVKNMKIDYGSNQSISFPQNIFNTLKEKEEIKEAYIEIGKKQSGIVGKAINLNREITVLDSLKFQNLKLNNVQVQTGSSALIGKDILSRMVVTINWKDLTLIMQLADSVQIDNRTLGFTMGYSEDNKVYVQSVIESSTAFKKGVKSGMQVLKLDSLNFVEQHTFCDFVDYANQQRNDVNLELLDDSGNIKEFYFEKEFLGKK
jgi:hypothetical protein